MNFTLSLQTGLAGNRLQSATRKGYIGIGGTLWQDKLMSKTNNFFNYHHKLVLSDRFATTGWTDWRSSGLGAGGGGAPFGRVCLGFGTGVNRATAGDDGPPPFDAELPLRQRRTPTCLGGSKLQNGQHWHC